MIKVYPTKFEAYDGADSIFNIEAMDEAAATVKIPTCVNVAMWDEIAPKIRECLVAMELK